MSLDVHALSRCATCGPIDNLGPHLGDFRVAPDVASLASCPIDVDLNASTFNQLNEHKRATLEVRQRFARE